MGKFAKRPITYNDKDVRYLTSLGFDEEFAQLLSFRGVTEQNASDYFGNDYSNIHDPFLMSNMAQAVATIKEFIDGKNKILIYGDYDADGLTASAILKLYFDAIGVECEIFVPTREDGYGLHVDLVLERYKQYPFDLLITVDCGISNKEEIAQIEKELGVTVVVTDHHELPEELPNCICINCKMGYPFAYLSGAGVALKLVEALSNRETAFLYADLATVGTIADMMPLVDENRDLVKYGLNNIHHRGLLKLAEMTKCDKIMTASSMALKICPKINSAGRVGNPYKALDLLLMSHRAKEEAVKELIDCNTLRQTLLERVILEANSKILEMDFSKEKMLFLCGETWPKGILGIGANRFKEAFKMPVAFLTEDGDEYVGSARANDDINLHELFSSVSNVLVRFGGHKGSVGFSVLKKDLPLLKSKINEKLKEYTTKAIQTYYDLRFSKSWLEQSNFEKLNYLEPFLPNEKPVFYAEDYCITAGTFGNGNLKFTLSCGLELKAFGSSFAQYLRYLKSGAECGVCFYLEVDKYTNRLFGSLIDIELKNSLKFDDLYACNFLARINDNISQDRVLLNELQTKEILLENNTVAVFNSYLDYEKAQNLFDFSSFVVEFFYQKSYCDKVVFISPDKLDFLDKYKNVIVFSFTKNYNLDFGKKAKYVDLPAVEPTYLDSILLDRKICAEVFSAISTCNLTNHDLHSFFDSQFFYCDRLQYFASIAVFKQLGLVKIDNDKIVQIYFDKKNLTDSFLYNKFIKKL